MASLHRLRIQISGTGVVGPGLMTFYSASGIAGLPADAITFLTALQSSFPDNVTFTVPAGGDVIESSDGLLTGSWTDGPGGTVTGSQTGSFQLGAGARIKWVTGGIVNGRRVRGTTFLVPFAGLGFDTDGRLGSATVAAVQTAASNFITNHGGNLAVWSRPVPGRAGSMHLISSAEVPTVGTQLRSRRV